MSKSEKIDCYQCKFRVSIPGDSHSTCSRVTAKVTGNKYGIKSGWFYWPWNFDPIWLLDCNGFEELKKG